MTVWYTAPTAMRMLMRAGAERPRATTCRACGSSPASASRSTRRRSCGAQEALGLPMHDNWWQTETGGIMIANLAGVTSGPGSMGRPAARRRGRRARPRRRRPGRGGRRRVREVDGPTARGELALRPGWPSMFRGYLHDEERYAQCFAGGWYLTGDVARRDADGWFWFVGRGDDVIKSAGHLIGPFEVESVLMEHPAVAEAGVIGMPDPVAGELVKAFVSSGRRRAHRRSCASSCSASAAAPRCRGRAEGDRVRPGTAAHPQRQDHAPAAQGAGAGPARGRSVDVGGAPA